MLLSEILYNHCGVDTIIFLHSSVVRSNSFDELVRCINDSKYKYRFFLTGKTELENLKTLGNSTISQRAKELIKYMVNGRISVSELSEYDLTSYNMSVAIGSLRILVVYGQKKAFADFTVHCTVRKPLNVLLLGNAKDRSHQISDPENIKSSIIRSVYSANWDKSSIHSIEQIKKGSKLYYYKNGKKTKLVLEEPISYMSGEGRVYQTSISGYCCKIYLRERLQKGLIAKLEYITKQAKLKDLAAWPESVVYDKSDCPVGCLMPFIKGESLDKLMHTWESHEWLEKVCTVGYSLSKAVFQLHSQNIVIGDISPKDILITKQMKLVFIDADSFQYDNYPCPGYMHEYRCKDLDTSRLCEKLRPFVYEYFSLAVILFEMLTHGHFPNEYTQPVSEIKFGETASSDNKLFDYKNMQFQLRVGSHLPHAPDSLVRCWNHIPEHLQSLFVDVFTFKRVVSATEWQEAFEKVLQKK